MHNSVPEEEGSRYYRAKVECTNCGLTGVFLFLKGETIRSSECFCCGCETIRRVE